MKNFTFNAGLALFPSAIFDLIRSLKKDGITLRFVGGCVRNALLDEPLGDFDLAANVSPDKLTTALQARGVRVIPTGLAHGTITALVEDIALEITSLRKDIHTDGRHARVSFTASWEEDSRRRDFTMNALYMDEDATVYDYTGGLDDLTHHRVRFIGEPEKRIREDILRILRFFRFHAFYGDKHSLDTSSLKACLDLASELPRLSGERIKNELEKFFKAPYAHLLYILPLMCEGEIFHHLFPIERFHLDACLYTLRFESQLSFPLSFPFKLAACFDFQCADYLSKRLKFSRADRYTMRVLETSSPTLFQEWDVLNSPQTQDIFLLSLLYRCGTQNAQQLMIKHWIQREICATKKEDKKSHDTDKRKTYLSVLQRLQTFEIPEFPIKARDLISFVKKGPSMGNAIKNLEGEWMKSGFCLSKQDLLDIVSREGFSKPS